MMLGQGRSAVFVYAWCLPKVLASTAVVLASIAIYMVLSACK